MLCVDSNQFANIRCIFNVMNGSLLNITSTHFIVIFSFNGILSGAWTITLKI